jgi:hypothetical protein
MFSWLQSKPNRRRDRAEGRGRFRPWLEVLEPRTALAVSPPAALAAPQFTPAPVTTTPAQVAIVATPAAGPSVFPAQPGLLTTPPGSNTGGAPPALALASGVSSGALPPQTPVAQTTNLPPEALSESSTAPLSVLSYADYQLTSGLDPALAGGQVPTVLNTPAVNALFEVGGTAGGATTPAPASTDNSAVAPTTIAPIDFGLLPQGQQAQPGLQGPTPYFPVPPGGQETDAPAGEPQAVPRPAGTGASPAPPLPPRPPFVPPEAAGRP